jgi:hypothetical protein
MEFKGRNVHRLGRRRLIGALVCSPVAIVFAEAATKAPSTPTGGSSRQGLVEVGLASNNAPSLDDGWDFC